MDNYLDNDQSPNPPPLWKQTLLLIAALFPPLMIQSMYLLPLLNALNPVIAKFISLAITVCITSTIIMPIAIYLFGWWLRSQTKTKDMLGIFIAIIVYVLELSLFTIIY